jgi:hypothetical protein
LKWTKNGMTPGPAVCNYVGNQLSWQEALDYIKCLNINSFLNYNDWRLPNVNELMTLINYGDVSSFSDWLKSVGFLTVPSVSWTSVNGISAKTNAYMVAHSSRGWVDLGAKTNWYYAWPVRGQNNGSIRLLQVSKSGNGTGTVVSAPSGVNCGIT